MRRLRQEKEIAFSSLFDEQASRMEIAVTFIALLELWHIGELAVRQKKAFSDIALVYRGGAEKD